MILNNKKIILKKPTDFDIRNRSGWIWIPDEIARQRMSSFAKYLFSAILGNNEYFLNRVCNFDKKEKKVYKQKKIAA